MGLIGKLGINDAKTFVMLPILQKTPPLHLHINVYTFSIISKYCMNSIVAQKFKIENQFSNTNHVYTMFKITLMLILEVLK